MNGLKPGPVAWARRGIFPDVAALLVLAMLALAFYWRIVTPDVGGRQSLWVGDFQEQYYPWRYHATAELAKGHFPLWTTYVYSGHPFFADLQTGVMYPPHLVLPLVARVLGDESISLYSLTLLTVFHVFLAAAFTYLLVRHLTANRLAGLVSGAVFAFGGYLTSYPIPGIALLEVVSWLPLVLLFVTLAIERRRLLWWLLAGIALTVSTLAGFPQLSLYIYYSVALYALFLIFFTGKDPSRPAVSRRHLVPLGGLAAGLGLSIGMAAVQLLPGWELAKFSTRGDVGYDFTSGGFGLREGLGLLLPNAMGGRTLYLGVIPLLLAAGALLWPMSRKVVFLAVLALIAFLVSFGRELPFYRILYVAAPGFDVFKDQERAAAVTSFCLAILAGFGVAGISSWPWEQARKRLKLLSALAGVVAILGGIAWLLLSRSQSVLAGLSQARREALAGDLPSIEIAALVAVAVFLLAAGRRLDVRAGLVLAAGVAGAQLFVINWNGAIAPGKPPVFYPESPLMEFLRDNLTTGRVELGSLAANSGYVYRLPVARGATPLETKYLADIVRTRSPRLWQLLDTEYTVAEAASPYARPVFEWQGQGVFKTPYPTARAYVAFRAMRFADDRQILDILSATGSDFLYGRDALLVDEPGVETTGKGYVSAIDVEEESPRSLAIRVNANSPGILVVSDVYYPGWKAYVDGAEKPILRANYFLRGVALSPGPHVVRMVFAPASVKIGALVSIIALGLVLALLVACAPIRQLHKRLGYVVLLALTLLSLGLSWRALAPRQVGIRLQDIEAASAYLRGHLQPGDALVLDPSLPAKDLASQLAGAPAAVVSRTPQSPAARIWRLTPLSRPRPEATEDAWRPPLVQMREERWFGDLYLALYEDTEAVQDAIAEKVQKRLGDSIQLLGYSLAVEKDGAQGSRLEVTLYWAALRQPDEAYAVFVQLLGPDGKLAFQDDSQPVMNARPTLGWQKGEVISDKHVLRLPASAAAGRYSMITGMYALTGERRLPVEGGGDFVPLQEIDVP